jgi:hypothetical protein
MLTRMAGIQSLDSDATGTDGGRDFADGRRQSNEIETGDGEDGDSIHNLTVYRCGNEDVSLEKGIVKRQKMGN